MTGQISGNSVVLQLTGPDGSNLGQIGTPAASDVQSATFNSTQNGYALRSFGGTGYAVYAPACGSGSLQSPADSGDICLGVNSATACQLPITLSPSAVIFPSEPIHSPPTLETITLTNTYGSILGGLTLLLTNNSGFVNFTKTDTCGIGGVDSQSQPFDLAPKQSCDITIAFSPQENCAAGTLTGQCLMGTLAVTSPNNDAIFSVPITGGVAASAASRYATRLRQDWHFAGPAHQRCSGYGISCGD